MIVRKKISRKKPSERATKKYFDNGTQSSIVDYQALNVVNDKNALYVEKILPAFQTLVDNLINVYGFSVLYDTKTNLRNECVSFLYEQLHKYDVTKGSRAFSYFNVVAKNWLTIKSKQNAKRVQTYSSLDDKDAMTMHDLETIEHYSIIPSCDEVVVTSEVTKNIKNVLDQIKERAKTDCELIAIESIMILFKDVEQLDLLNKRATMLYLKEMTRLPTKQLTVAMSAIKKYYKEIKKGNMLNDSSQ